MTLADWTAKQRINELTGSNKKTWKKILGDISELRGNFRQKFSIPKWREETGKSKYLKN